MNIKKITVLALTILSLNFGLLTSAYAGVDVKCEVRAGRSKLSVDGFRLANGLYRARVLSGNSTPVWSKNYLRPSAGEAEFDFDSNPADIRAGATAVPTTFIKNGKATGQIFIRNSNGSLTLKAAEASTCRVRVR